VLTVYHTQSTNSSHFVSSPLPVVCKKNLCFDTTWCRPPSLLRATRPPSQDLPLETLLVSFCIKHRSPWLPTQDSQHPRAPFHALQKSQSIIFSSFSLGPSSDVTLGDDHTIADADTSGLKSNYFWSHNSPRASTFPPGETTL
jgi:hypothetical protein